MFESPAMIWVIVLALILFGGNRLPGVAKSVGEALREFKKAANEIDTPAPPVATQPAPPQQVAEAPRRMEAAHDEAQATTSVHS